MIKRSQPTGSTATGTISQGAVEFWLKGEIPQAANRAGINSFVKFVLTICGHPIVPTANEFTEDIDVYVQDQLTNDKSTKNLNDYFTGWTTDCPVKTYSLHVAGQATAFSSTTFVVNSNLLEITHLQVQDFSFDVKASIPLVTAVTKRMNFRMGCFAESNLVGKLQRESNIAWDYAITGTLNTAEFKLVI